MNREEKLKLEFNNFLISKFKLDNIDYYSLLSTNDFIDLKSFVSNVNNIVTMKLTLNFIETLTEFFHFSELDKSNIIQNVQSVNPNTNGFDIEIETPVKIIAEIKGNVPINDGETFGSAQKTAIKKDFNSLKNGKPKSFANTNDYYKFFVLPDIEKTKVATISFLKTLKNNSEYKNYSFEFLSEAKGKLNKSSIYIVFVNVT